ncbi:MAG: TolC family protein [Acidobacteriota bacterium]
MGVLGPVVISMLVLCMAGCVTTGPQGTHGAAGEIVEELPPDWSAESQVGPITRHLLDLIDDPQLHDLVHEALEANQDLRALSHRLRASRRLLVETRAASSPVVSTRYAPGRGNQVFDALGEPGVQTRHRAAVDVSWEIDLWGRLADLHGAEVARTEAQAAEVAAARDLLGARVIQDWVTAVSLHRAIALEVERLLVLERLQATITRRYLRGLAGPDDLAAARLEAELARTTMAALEGELETAHRGIELLLGRTPRGLLASADTLPSVHRVNPGIPATALAHRPDVIAALLRLRSADAAAAAAAKALLPSLQLNGELALDAATLPDLPGAATLWNLVGGLVQPVFQRGALRARSESSQWELRAAWEDYRSAVRRALAEVENALALERSLMRQRDHLATAMHEAERNAQVFEGRYRAGLASILELLQAEGQKMDLRRQALEVHGELLRNRVTLALAVGAGFEEPEP